MHVAFDVAQTGVERAGCAWYADGLAQALARRPEVIVDLYPHFHAWINTADAIPTRHPQARSPLDGLTPEACRALWQAADRAGLPGGPEIVHANSFQAPRVANAQLVFTVHDLSFWTHPDLTTEATRLHCERGMLDALERAAGLVFVSRAARDEFEQVLPGWLDESRRPWCVVPGASRFPTAASATSPAPDGPWLCVGSLEPRKNHATVLDAYETYARRVARPRPLHLIGGRGWHSEHVRERIRTLTEVGVVYRGYVTEPELAAAYRGAFGLIQASWHEGFGLPVIEAGGFGVPTLCSDIPSLREVGGEGARYFNPRSSPELTDCLVELHETPSQWVRQSAMAVQNARRYTWDSSAATLLAFYRTLVR